MSKKFILIVLVIAIAILSSACGGDGSETSSRTAVGCTVVENVLNAGANANGDGQVDTTPCNGIVCP